MTLLSKQYTKYYITKNYWDFGGGFIFDKNYKKIGKIENKLFSVNKRFEIRGIDNQIVATIQKRIASPHKKQLIKNDVGKDIGTVKRKKIPFKPPKFYFKQGKEKYKYIALGTKFQNSFEIFDFNNIKIAKVSKVKHSMNNLDSSINNDGEFLVLEIINNNINRIELITMVLSIENILYTTFFLSDIAGYGRLTMRLRPFGPGIKENNLK